MSYTVRCISRAWQTCSYFGSGTSLWIFREAPPAYALRSTAANSTSLRLATTSPTV
jgi:hypothetical protein